MHCNVSIDWLQYCNLTHSNTLKNSNCAPSTKYSGITSSPKYSLICSLCACQVIIIIPWCTITVKYHWSYFPGFAVGKQLDQNGTFSESSAGEVPLNLSQKISKRGEILLLYSSFWEWRMQCFGIHCGGSYNEVKHTCCPGWNCVKQHTGCRPSTNPNPWSLPSPSWPRTWACVRVPGGICHATYKVSVCVCLWVCVGGLILFTFPRKVSNASLPFSSSCPHNNLTSPPSWLTVVRDHSHPQTWISDWRGNVGVTRCGGDVWW